MYTARVPPLPLDATDAGSAPLAAAEVVRRPDPGLARGVWETKPALFYALGGAVVLVTAIWGIHRLGWLRRLRVRLARVAR